MTWGEKKLQAISVCLLDLPFLTSATLRTHCLFSLVYGSLYKFTSLSPCEWGKGLGGHSRPPRRSSLLCEMGRSFPDWSGSANHPSFYSPFVRKSWSTIVMAMPGSLQSSVDVAGLQP